MCCAFIALPSAITSFDSVKKALPSSDESNTEQIIEKAQKKITEATKEISKDSEKATKKIAKSVENAVDEAKSEYDKWIEEKSKAETEEFKHHKSGILRKGSSILREGLEVIPPEGGQVVLFRMGGKIGVAFNRSDLFVLYEPQFEDAYNEDFSKSNGMVLLKRDGKWGALNTTARPGAGIADVTVPFVFDRLTPFRNGKSTATLNGKTFVIDTMGKKIN